MEGSVVIVGGGIAGLTAGVELLSLGWRVTILEAKHRLGGRIHTIRSGNTPVELGAEFVHGDNPALRDFIDQAELSTQTVKDKNQVFRDGRLQPVALWDRISEIMRRIDPDAPDEPFATFVQRVLTSPEDRELALGFVQGFNAADPARVSAHALLRSEISAEKSGGSQQARLRPGYGALVQWLATRVREHGGEIRTGTAAGAIDWKPHHVEVLADQQGRRQRFTADAALITLPLGVLKTGAFKFKPSLSRKNEAIANLLFGNVRRVTLVFREPWWPEHDLGFVHSFSEPLPTWWSDPRGPVLTGWAGGPLAGALVNRSEHELGILAIEILAKIFSESRSALHQRLLQIHTHDWAMDPHVRGAYSYVPVLGLDLPKVLAEPIDETLFFAGEATVMDAQMGTVFGAVESARRAVKEMSEIYSAAGP
jgi:monoamine oxidase